MRWLGIRRMVSDRVVQTFVAGLIGILPVAISFAILAWIVITLHDLVGPQSSFGTVLRSVGMTVSACEVVAYGIGVVGTTLLVYILGAAVESGFAHRWHGPIDNALTRVPVFSTLYDASKNLTSMFTRKKDSMTGMVSVLCFFGPDGSIGTPALMPTSRPVQFGGQEYRVVIIPTAPVPFGGAIFCVRADLVKPIGCSFDELMGIYISMGVSAPDCLRDEQSVSSPQSFPFHQSASSTDDQ